MPSKKKASKALVVVEQAPVKMGRPSKRTPEVVDYILDGLSEGKTLTSLCAGPDMPNRSTFIDWVNGDRQLSQRFAHARETGYDVIAEECLKIADFSALDTLINEKTGNPQADSEWIARSRLRVDTRLKLLAKWYPKKYGDKIDVEHSGSTDMKITFKIGGKTIE
jgi:hypothetical protein